VLDRARVSDRQDSGLAVGAHAGAGGGASGAAAAGNGVGQCADVGLGRRRSPTPPGPPGAPPPAGPPAPAPPPRPAESVYARPARGRAVALWRGGTRLPVALA